MRAANGGMAQDGTSCLPPAWHACGGVKNHARQGLQSLLLHVR